MSQVCKVDLIVSWVSRTCCTTSHLPFRMTAKKHSEKCFTHASLSSSTISFLHLSLALSHMDFHSFCRHIPLLCPPPCPFTPCPQFSSPNVLPSPVFFCLFLHFTGRFSSFQLFLLPHSLVSYSLCLSLLVSLPSLISLLMSPLLGLSFSYIHIAFPLISPSHPFHIFHLTPPSLPCPLPHTLPSLSLSRDTDLTHGLWISKSNIQTYSRCMAHKSAHSGFDTRVERGTSVQTVCTA